MDDPASSFSRWRSMLPPHASSNACGRRCLPFEFAATLCQRDGRIAVRYSLCSPDLLFFRVNDEETDQRRHARATKHESTNHDELQKPNRKHHAGATCTLSVEHSLPTVDSESKSNSSGASQHANPKTTPETAAPTNEATNQPIVKYATNPITLPENIAKQAAIGLARGNTDRRRSAKCNCRPSDRQRTGPLPTSPHSARRSPRQAHPDP